MDENRTVKDLLEEISKNEKYNGCVFWGPGIYFVIGNGKLWEISDDAGCTPRGGWFPDIVSGPSKEEKEFISLIIEEFEIDEDFFSAIIEDYGEFDDEYATEFFEDNEDEEFIPPDTDMQSATKMRTVLRGLASTAEKNHCAVILIGHMNKGSGAKSLYRGLGSIDIAAIARSVLMISRDETRPGIRYMYPIKSSLAPEGPAVAFSFREGGGIEWQGQYDLNTAALTDSVTVKTTKRDKARAKMLQLLEDSDKPAKVIYESLAGLGVGSRTVEKVKKELQIKTYRAKGCWYWSLPKLDN